MGKIYNLVVILGTLGICILSGCVDQPTTPLWIAIPATVLALPAMIWGVVASVKLDLEEKQTKRSLLIAIVTTLGGLVMLTYLWEPLLQW